MRIARNCLYLSVLLLSLLPAAPLRAGTDKNIVIRERKERYEFTKGDAKNPVWVKQYFSTTYRCNEFRSTIPYSTFYDDYSRVDDVKAYVNGDRVKGLRPQHGYYAVEGFFYSDARVCGFMLDLEKKGSESRVELEKTMLDPRYFTTVYFNEDFFLHRKEITLVVPRWMQLEIKEMNFGAAGISKSKVFDEKANADVYTYTVVDQPAAKKEALAPGPSYLYPHLLICSHYAETPGGRVTYFGSVKDLYGWYHSLVKETGNDAAAVKEAAQQIAAGKNSDLEKVAAVYAWVQENIRYIAFEDGIAGFRPAPAQDVLQKKYGDCKGMANLLKEMLVSLGLDARLCWIGTRHIAYDYSMPTLSVDNHMICAVNLQGKQYFLDATETYIGLDEYAERIQGRQVLVENGEQYTLTRVPERTYEQNRQQEQRRLRIEGSTLTGTTLHNITGECTEYLLTQAHAIKKEKLEEALQQYLTAEDRLYAISGIQTKGLHQRGPELTIQYNIEHKEAVNSFGDEMYIDLDFRKEMDDAAIDTLTRVHDLWLHFKRQVLQETSLAIPAGYKVKTLPEPLIVNQPKYAFSAAYEIKGNEVIYRKEIIIKNTRLLKSEFGQWNADIRRLKQAYQEQLTLTKK
ncbi:transglutaminase domain-containing protein [Chitinophaga sp.]|uniref:transglutaminase-like domain-containing protein n=1 Tax=Chitinophaga sp. TaxID=1869181 RepID=UPI0031DE73E0